MGERAAILTEGLGLGKAEALHGLRLASAASLAFAIASFLHVGNAYWAAMPIWVVSQATKGLLFEKAAFRLLGTLVGAGVGFTLVWLNLGTVPALALLGIWIGIHAFLSQTLRGVHGYATLLAGMTAAIVVLPSAFNLDHAVGLASARVECTLIGVVCVTLVMTPWTPGAARNAFYKRVGGLAKHAREAAASGPSLGGRVTRQLLREMAELQAEAGMVSAGSVEGYRRLHHVDALIVAVLAALAEAQALDWSLRIGGSLSGLASAAAGHERRIAEALGRLEKAEHAFDGEGLGADARSFRAKLVHFAPHLDLWMATECAVFAGAGTFAVALLAVKSGWPAGELTALGVCIFSMVLGSLPSPRAVAPVMLKGVSIGALAALLWRLVIQPHVHTPLALILSLVPILVIGGLARASRKTAGPALDANMCFLLASQAVLPAVTETAAILSGTAALMLAVGIVAPVFMILPSGPERRATNAARAIRRDLIRMVRVSAPVDPDRSKTRTARQILRLSLHVERHVGLSRDPEASPLAALILGNAIARLVEQRNDPLADAATRRIVTEALGRLEHMDDDPARMADELERLAEDRSAPEDLAVGLRETAAALRASESLLLVRRGAQPGG